MQGTFVSFIISKRTLSRNFMFCCLLFGRGCIFFGRMEQRMFRHSTQHLHVLVFLARWFRFRPLCANSYVRKIDPCPCSGRSTVHPLRDYLAHQLHSTNELVSTATKHSCKQRFMTNKSAIYVICILSNEMCNHHHQTPIPFPTVTDTT